MMIDSTKNNNKRMMTTMGKRGGDFGGGWWVWFHHSLLSLLLVLHFRLLLLEGSVGGRAFVVVRALSNNFPPTSPSGPTTSPSFPRARIALVTGANKGIGREIAKLLAATSNNTNDDDQPIIPIVACRTDGSQTAHDLGIEHYVNLDLTEETSIQHCADYVRKNFGRLDILINNAAICFNDPTLYGKVSYTPFEQQANITIETNYFGTQRLCQALMPLIVSSPGAQQHQDNDDDNDEDMHSTRFLPPRIINIASYAGRLGILRNNREKIDKFTNPNLTVDQLNQDMQDFCQAVEKGVHAQQGWPNTCYGMSKLGIIAYTKILARDYSANPLVLVNSVDPGYCATDQNNNQGTRPASRGAMTPFLLATTHEHHSARHWLDEQEIDW